jgi:RNA polymerase sigma factor (sigma-70 family)
MLKPGMAGRKRAAVELTARKGAELRATAARFSLCPDDAEDAYQRALEILLLKAPTDDPQDLLRWTKTVVKHEALAVRRNRERLLGRMGPWAEDEDGGDRAARQPSHEDSPEERCERGEELAGRREVLRSLKPAELRSLTLLAAGYSYAEIADQTGYSRRKVNRSLAEGRERLRGLVARGEDGSRCADMRRLLSAYCDGEADAEQARAVREHLRACAGCRVAMRAYRSAPETVAALAPALPLSRSLLERAQDLLVAAQARLPGGAAEAGAAQTVAAGGTRGGGMAAMAKLLTICAGTAGAGAACVAGGVAPPLGLPAQSAEPPRAERVAKQASAEAGPPAVEYEPAPEPEAAPPPPAEPEPPPQPAPEPIAEPGPPATEAGAVEYAQPPPTQSAPAASASSASEGGSNGSAAGEFGP